MALTSQIQREWRILTSDGWLKALLFWLPVVLFVTIWAIFSAGIARDLAIGVVDLDHSRMSRGLVRYYDASPTLEVTQQFNSVAQGSQALRNGDIYALVVIPHELEKDHARASPGCDCVLQQSVPLNWKVNKFCNESGSRNLYRSH